MTLLPAALAASLAWATPAQAQSANAAPDNGAIDLHQLFATTCGWCHSDGSRVAGKGPQLMDTRRDDDFIRDRIKHGKLGAMPAFGSIFSDAQIDQIIKYIRELKPGCGGETWCRDLRSAPDRDFRNYSVVGALKGDQDQVADRRTAPPLERARVAGPAGKSSQPEPAWRSTFDNEQWASDQRKEVRHD
jgi:cytochrome c553